MTTRIDQTLQAILSKQAAPVDLTIKRMREHALYSKMEWNNAAASVSYETTTCSTVDAKIPMRVYKPQNARMKPIIHVHGGGWSICTPQTHHAIYAALADISRRTVYAPHPRQAPEYPYPAASNDILAVMREVHNVAPGGFFLSGDSAGAHLALGAMLRNRDEVATLGIRAAILFFGCYRRRFDTDSHRRFGDGSYGLSTAKMTTFWEAFAPLDAEGLYYDLDGSDFSGLPPMQVQTAGFDPLLDDSIWLADQLRQADNVTECIHWDSMNHGFLHYVPELPVAQEALQRACDFLERFD